MGMHYVVHGRCYGERHGICQDFIDFSAAEKQIKDWYKTELFDEIRLEKFGSKAQAVAFMISRERPYNADW